MPSAKENAQSKLSQAPNANNLIVLNTCCSCLPFGCRDMYSCDTYMGNWTSIIIQCEACTEFCCCASSCQNTKCFALACLCDSDVEGECCVIADAEVIYKQSTLCCKAETQLCCIDTRVVCPYEPNREHPEQEEVPCVLAIGGCNICVDNELKIGFCQPLSSYRKSKETCVCNMDPMCLCNGIGPDETVTPPPPGERKSATKEISPWKEGDPIPENETKTSVGMPKLEDLYVLSACCCTINSIYWEFPQIFGAFTEQQICCVHATSAFNKPAVLKGEIYQGDNTICMSGRVALMEFSHFVCCQAVSQMCCLDTRAALPCTDDVPCMLNYCCINCCYNWSPNCACTYFSQIKDLQGDPMAAKAQ